MFTNRIRVTQESHMFHRARVLFSMTRWIIASCCHDRLWYPNFFEKVNIKRVSRPYPAGFLLRLNIHQHTWSMDVIPIVVIVCIATQGKNRRPADTVLSAPHSFDINYYVNLKEFQLPILPTFIPPCDPLIITKLFSPSHVFLLYHWGAKYSVDTSLPRSRHGALDVEREPAHHVCVIFILCHETILEFWI